MKASHIYIIGIGLFFVIMLAVEYYSPKKFVWRPTFSQHDKQPFGSAIFDDVVAASLSSGYTVTDKTIYQLAQDSICDTGVLVVTERLSLVKADVNAMLDMTARGNTFMLVSTSFNSLVTDTLGFDWDYEYYDLSSFNRQISSGLRKDSIRWEKDSLYDTRIFTAYSHLYRSFFTEQDSLTSILAVKNELHAYYNYHEKEDTTAVETYFHPPVAISKKIGEGEIILVSTPLLFTNYGMLDGDNSDYLFRLLSQMRGMPLVRTEAYAVSGYEEQSPFRYFLSQRPLRWALYATVLLILAFMIFTARRRQRAIPVMKDPENRSVEFTELIATLYYQKKDHTGLVRKKYLYFAETLRRTIQVDVEAGEDATSSAGRIAWKTGLEEKKIEKLLTDIHPVIHGNAQLTEDQMKDFIGRMNEIINHL